MASEYQRHRDAVSIGVMTLATAVFAAIIGWLEVSRNNATREFRENCKQCMVQQHTTKEKETNLDRKLANHNQRAKNRARWRWDLTQPESEQSRCVDQMCMRYTAPDQPPKAQWCAGGRAVQLLIDNTDMLVQEHPDLQGTPSVGWIMSSAEMEQDHSSYPCSVPAIPDVNSSAFDGFYDLIEQVYGVDERTMREIENASDTGKPMRDIA